MKKVVLSILMVGALVATSCKGEKKEVKDAANEVVTEVTKKTEEVVEDTKDVVSDMIDSALEGVKIPNFEDAKVTEHLKAYATYAKDYIDAKGDVVKNAALAKKGVELVTKGKEILGSLDEESAKKFKSVMNAIQSKMAPAN